MTHSSQKPKCSSHLSLPEYQCFTSALQWCYERMTSKTTYYCSGLANWGLSHLPEYVNAFKFACKSFIVEFTLSGISWNPEPAYWWKNSTLQPFISSSPTIHLVLLISFSWDNSLISSNQGVPICSQIRLQCWQRQAGRCAHTELTSVIRHMPVLMSHILMVLSLDPESRKGPGLPLFLVYKWGKIDT